jgi:hypothetical protein
VDDEAALAALECAYAFSWLSIWARWSRPEKST